jgi:predicted permease
MNPLTRFTTRLAMLFRRSQFSDELEEEMSFHREQAEREFVRGGMSPEAAHYAAARQFGNAALLKDQSVCAVAFRVETVLQDLRFALRQFRRNPGFAATAILILALGMGVSVAIFAFVDAALLQSLPYAQPNRLLSVDEASAMFPHSNLSYDDYVDWKRLNKSLSSLDVYNGTGYLLRSAGGTEPVPAARVSDGFFSTLGVRPMLGRVFLPGEDRPGQAKIVILSYATWMKRFGGRSDVIGQSVSLSAANYIIVGVLPREFAFAPRGNAEFWTPLLDKNGCEQRRSCHNLDGLGRLRDGVSLAAASADLKAIAAQLEQQYPGSNHGQSADLVPLTQIITGDIRPILLMLLGGAGLLLLIACVNVASLLLVRSESRRREIAVRGALGATFARLLRQFVTEGLLLACLGCTAGLGLAWWIMILLPRMIPKDMALRTPFLQNVGLNAHVAIFAAAIAALAALLLAATPGMRLASQDIRQGLADGDRGAAGRLWRRLGANLVVVELAVAVVLLVGAGLLGQSFYRLLHVQTGFDATHLATVYVMAPDNAYGKDPQRVALYREIERRLSALPGVQSVGLTSVLPIQCNCNTDWIRIVGKPFHGEHNEVDERDVSPNYLQTLKARLVAGRMPTSDEDGSKPQVILINQSLAKKYFPGEDPIGQKVGNGGLTADSMREIVGVVADVREGALDDAVWPTEYQALYQSTDDYFNVAVRTAGDEGSLLPVLVSTLHQIDPNLGVFGEQTMQQQVEATPAAVLHRFSTWIVGGFAFAALLLGVVGLYGVIAYAVSQRTREIGVRMALGAKRSSVYTLVMRQAGWLTAVGLASGLLCSIGASLLMRKLLFGIQAWDLPTLGFVAILLGLASMCASFLPAHRAASVNPIDALRADC